MEAGGVVGVFSHLGDGERDPGFLTWRIKSVQGCTAEDRWWSFGGNVSSYFLYYTWAIFFKPLSCPTVKQQQCDWRSFLCHLCFLRMSLLSCILHHNEYYYICFINEYWTWPKLLRKTHKLSQQNTNSINHKRHDKQKETATSTKTTKDFRHQNRLNRRSNGQRMINTYLRMHLFINEYTYSFIGIRTC